MKTCPVCNASAFDDAGACYGCGHRFEEEAAANVASPAFSICFTPEIDKSGGVTWHCTVKLT